MMQCRNADLGRHTFFRTLETNVEFLPNGNIMSYPVDAGGNRLIVCTYTELMLACGELIAGSWSLTVVIHQSNFIVTHQPVS